MSVIRSGGFQFTHPVVVVTGPWTPGTVAGSLPPIPTWTLFPGQSGTIDVSFLAGTTLVVTSADGTFDIGDPPPGFTPTSPLGVFWNANWPTAHVGDVHAVSDLGVASGPIAGAFGPLPLPAYRSFFLLSTDLLRIAISLDPAGSVGAEIRDNPTYGVLSIGGGYDIVSYWWTIPARSACGDRQTPHLALTADDPGPPWVRLDPLDPDAAPTPVIDAIVPSHGAIAGGTAVEILGAGFGDACTVAFDGVPATSVVVVSATQITCVAPAHVAGSAAVVVTNEDGATS